MRYLLNRIIPTGSVVLMLTTMGSYAMGLLRDRLFAQTFGLSSQLDAYNAAFLLPDFLFNLLVASGIAAAVVPIFSSLRQRGLSASYDYLNSLISASLLLMAFIGIVLAIFAKPAAALVAPGLGESDLLLTAQLMRVLALSPLFFALSNALGAALVAQKRFLFYGLSPIFYNAGIIGGTIFLAPQLGVFGTALGTIIGAGLHALVRVVDSWRTGWRPKVVFAWRSADFTETIRLMLPKMLGHPVELVTFWLFTVLASHLATGSISALNFARNFQSVPVSLIGIAVSTAVFPVLADALARRAPGEYYAALWRNLFSIAFLSVAAALALFAIRVPLITLLLGGGSFDEAAVARTASVLAVFCLAVPTESVSHLLARAFYARRNTLTPVLFSVTSLVIAVTVGWLLLPVFGLTALPLGFFCGSLAKAIGLSGLSYRYQVVATQQ